MRKPNSVIMVSFFSKCMSVGVSLLLALTLLLGQSLLPIAKVYACPKPITAEGDEDKLLTSVNEDCVGDPINTLTGKYFDTITDLELNGLMPFRFVRHYNNRSTYDSPLGYGWASNFDRRLYKYADKSIVIRVRSGIREKYVYTGGAYVPEVGKFQRLSEQPDGSFIRTSVNGEKEYFDSAGRFVKHIVPAGHWLELEYDKRGHLPLIGTSPYTLDPSKPRAVSRDYRVLKVTEYAADGVATGNSMSLVYDDATGRLGSVTASDGRKVSYLFDETESAKKGNLLKVAGLEGINSYFKYEDPNDFHNVTHFRTGEDRIDRINTYDLQDRVIVQAYGNYKVQLDYEIPGLRTVTTEDIRDEANPNLGEPAEMQRIKIAEVDENLRLLFKRDGDREVRYIRDSATQQVIAKEWYEYPNGQEEAVLKRRSDYRNNADGQQDSEQTVLASGEIIHSRSSFEKGKLKKLERWSSFKPSDISTIEYQFDYNAAGNPIRIKSEETATETGKSLITRYHYDGKSRLYRTVRPDGISQITEYGDSLYPKRSYLEFNGKALNVGVVEYEYDDYGYVSKTTDAKGQVTETQFDELGRLRALKNANGEETLYTYTDARLTGIEMGKLGEEAGLTTRIVYDNKHRVSRVEVKKQSDDWQVIDSRTYDTRDLVLTQTRGELPAKQNKYSIYGQLIQSIDENGFVTEYQYDDLGNRIYQKDPEDHISHYYYNKLNRLVKVSQETDTNVASKIDTEYAYNVLGQATQVTDGEGKITRYEYDLAGRITAEVKPTGARTETKYSNDGRIDYLLNARKQKMQFKYKDWGNVELVNYFASIDASVAERTVGYQYDNNGNVVSVSDTSVQASPLYSFAHDKLNRIATTTVRYLPGGERVIEENYHRFGDLAKVSLVDNARLETQYQYNALGQRQQITLSDGGEMQLTYTPGLQLDEITHTNGFITNHGYRDRGDLTLKKLTKPTAGLVSNRVYTHDNIGNIENITDIVGNWSYGYDDQSRLITASYPAGTGLNGTDDYSYDNVGNRIKQADPSAYQYGDDHSLLLAPQGSYAYDADGNQTNRPDGAVLSYNIDNRLKQYKKGGDTFSYRYDPMGRRIAKTVNGITTWYVWHNQSLMAEYNQSGQRQKYYEYGLSYAPLQLTDENGSYQVHTDHLDTPIFLTNANQKVVWDSNQRAFGQANINEDVDLDGQNITFNTRFPGQYYDGETGLHYNYFRDYDPELGRYIQSDPIGLAGGMNTYGYVGGNPISYIDPLGLRARIPSRPNPVRPGNHDVNNYFTNGNNDHTAYARGLSKLNEYQKNLLPPDLKNLKRCSCNSAIPVNLNGKTFIPDGTNQCTVYDEDGNGINDSSGYPLKGCSCTY